MSHSGRGSASDAENRQHPPHGERPNVVLVFMDDMTHWAIGRLGGDQISTPNLDRLVDRGTAFTHAVNQGSWTGAVCVPARAMMLTGRTLFRARQAIDATSVADRVPLLGEALGQAGYRTYFTGKWHNSRDALGRSYGTVGPHAGGMLQPAQLLDGSQDVGRPAAGNTWDPTDPAGEGHWMRVDGRIVHSSERWVDAALQQLRCWNVGSDPYFLHVAPHAPHDPRQAPARWFDRYPPELVQLPPNLLPQHPFDQGDYFGRDELLAPFPRTPDVVRLHRREYQAIVSHADEQIGRLLDAVEARGESEQTVVVFSGDHGLALGEHGLMGKQSMYDHSVRVPLVIAGPGIPRGRRVDNLVYQASIYPTLCDLLGIDIPPSVEFPSLARLMDEQPSGITVDDDAVGGDGANPSPDDDEAVFGAYRHLQRMIRTRRWALIAYGEARRLQLFDMVDDPWQMRDLSADPDHASTVHHLLRRLRQMQGELGDTSGSWTADVDDSWVGGHQISGATVPSVPSHSAPTFAARPK